MCQYVVSFSGAIGGYKTTRLFYEPSLQLSSQKGMDPRLVRAGVEDYNLPRTTPNHPTKSHVVVARFKEGGRTVVKTIRFGQQGAETAGRPRKGESARMKKKRASFKSRHARNIARGPASAAWWADRYKW